MWAERIVPRVGHQKSVPKGGWLGNHQKNRVPRNLDGLSSFVSCFVLSWYLGSLGFRTKALIFRPILTSRHNEVSDSGNHSAATQNWPTSIFPVDCNTIPFMSDVKTNQIHVCSKLFCVKICYFLLKCWK